MARRAQFGVSVLLVWVLWASWALAAGPATRPATRPAVSGDVPGPYSYAATARKDYSAVTLRVLAPRMTALGAPAREHARQFAELTGARVDVTYVPFDEYYAELIWGLRKKQFDVVFFGQVWLPDVYLFLEPVPPAMLASAQFLAVDPIQKDAARWEGTYYTVSIDGDCYFLQYRRDLFARPALRAEFKRRWGRELAPPATWKELQQVAEFFHGRDVGGGKKVSGVVEVTNIHSANFIAHMFLKRAAPYTKHPDVKGGHYFDLASMRPLINTPGFVEALTDFVAIQAYSLPRDGGPTFTDHVSAFANGEVVLTDSWIDPFMYAMEPGNLPNKVAVAPSPGARKVWNRRRGRWDEFPQVNQVAVVPTSWTSAVAASTEHKAAAFAFLGFFANEANHAADLLAGDSGINPSRAGDLSPAFWVERAGWDPAVAATYINTCRRQSAAKNRAYALTIHLGSQYLKVLAIGVHRALIGRDPPQRALDSVADRWDQLTRRVGVAKQRKAYAAIVALEDRR